MHTNLPQAPDGTGGGDPHLIRLPAVTSIGFGCRLRVERERRRITLASIAANTKISIALLESLERDDVSRWPSGIFRRSFIRAYATSVGLDADATAREFLARFPDPLELTPVDSATSKPAGVKEDAPVGAGLRLKLEDSDATFKAGRVLARASRRLAAVAWDMGVLIIIGLAFFITLHRFWMPLAVAMLAYYASSIVILGNTPGVCLFAPVSSRNDIDEHSKRRAFVRRALGAAFGWIHVRRASRVEHSSAVPEPPPRVDQPLGPHPSLVSRTR